MKTFRKLLKYLLPHGVVEMSKNSRRVRDLGGRLSARDYWRSDWLVHEAEVAGLDLLPNGQWRQLRTVVDVGANVGQWSTMLLDLVSPQRLVISSRNQPPSRVATAIRRPANVELHPDAVGDTEGVIKFQVTRDTTGASVLAPREEMRELIGSNWTVSRRSRCRCSVSTRCSPALTRSRC